MTIRIWGSSVGIILGASDSFCFGSCRVMDYLQLFVHMHYTILSFSSCIMFMVILVDGDHIHLLFIETNIFLLQQRHHRDWKSLFESFIIINHFIYQAFQNNKHDLVFKGKLRTFYLPSPSQITPISVLPNSFSWKTLTFVAGRILRADWRLEKCLSRYWRNMFIFSIGIIWLRDLQLFEHLTEKQHIFPPSSLTER